MHNRVYETGVRLSVCLSVRLSLCLSVRPSVCLSVSWFDGFAAERHAGRKYRSTAAFSFNFTDYKYSYANCRNSDQRVRQNSLNSHDKVANLTPATVTHTHTHIRLTDLCPGLPRWAGIRKVRPIWILLKQETVSGSGNSWAMCKSASRSRQITTPAPHHSVFTGRMPFLPPNQQRQSTEGTISIS